jgi:1,4-dihydroxy-2-naphthoate octaprenyltransferase
MNTVLYDNKHVKINLWVTALRAPFFTASIIPVILGTAVAYYSTGLFNLTFFMLTLIGIVCLQATGNLLNDYFDFKSGADIINKERTPFSGGSGVLVDGLLTPKTILISSLSFLFAGLFIGAYLAFNIGLELIILGIIGALLGIAYTAPPFKLVYRGLGELVVALAFGPLVVAGAFIVQTETISATPIVASIPIALLIASVLYINEFPDYKADKAAGKNQLVVIIGRKDAVRIYKSLIISAYLSIVFGVILGLMPSLTLLGILTFPMAKRAIGLLQEHYSEVQKLLPANELTVKIHFQTGALLSASYLLSYLIKF